MSASECREKGGVQCRVSVEAEGGVKAVPRQCRVSRRGSSRQKAVSKVTVEALSSVEACVCVPLDRGGNRGQLELRGRGGPRRLLEDLVEIARV